MIIHDILDLGELEWSEFELPEEHAAVQVQALSWGRHAHEGAPLHSFYGPTREDVMAWLEGPLGHAYATGWWQRRVYEIRLLNEEVSA